MLIKKKPFMERLGAGLIYNPLEAFSEGVDVNLYGSYAFTHQFGFLAGINWKESFSNSSQVVREGGGLHTALRFTKDRWLFQGGWNTTG
jgi:hypothetical protein